MKGCLPHRTILPQGEIIGLTFYLLLFGNYLGKFPKNAQSFYLLSTLGNPLVVVVHMVDSIERVQRGADEAIPLISLLFRKG